MSFFFYYKILENLKLILMQYTIIQNNTKYKKKKRKRKDTRLLKSLKKIEKKNITYIDRSGGILK